jgi:hypothetical protein
MKFYIETSTGKRIDMPGHRGVKYWKLRTPEAVARRRKYKANKPKKKRIQCQFCLKRFTPKRSTARFCGPVCRNKSNIREWKLFRRYGLVDEWFRLPPGARNQTSQLAFLRDELHKLILGIRR